MEGTGISLTYTQPQLDIFFGDVKRFNAIAKGRRFGATRGAAHACIEWCIEGMPVLWGDTVQGNISRYVDRYFLPVLRASSIDHEWRQQERILKVGSGYIDFRSADRPENWEGFGYKRIVLNEAGIILKDPYLYFNAVLPMMMDYPDAKLFALGVPKGKVLRDGRDHPFWRLYGANTPDHRALTYSTYDNPFLSDDDIEATKAEIAAMSPEEVAQEIYGEFLDRTGDIPFAHAFDQAKTIGPCELDLRQPVIVSIDFNVEPFCAIVAQVRKHSAEVVVTHEIAIRSGTISEMAERIRAICPASFNLLLTGDSTGASRRIGRNSTASLWEDLKDALRVNDTQIKLPTNPSHVESREQVNYLFANHPSITINPRCSGLILDLKTVQVDSDRKLVKADRSQGSQRADLLDTYRYLCNTFLHGWVEQHRKTHALRQHTNRPTALSVRR
jgi:hypothetical protein